MNSLPVRLFHASLSGILVVVFITLLVFHVQQRFHTELPRQDIVRVVEREVKKPTPVTPSATSDPNDRDGDGIPNTWETTYSHNPDNAKDSGSDFDFDGLTAKQEYDLSVQTGGLYGNPLGKYELSSTTLPDDFANDLNTGAPLITSVTLIDVAKNGLTLARVGGVLAGAAAHTYTNYTYDPFSQKWTRILPPSDVPLSTSMVATDVNSQGQVVGYYYSGGNKGFIWNPAAPGSLSGESKQFYLNPEAVPPNSPTAAIPKRISDTGYLLYSIGSPYSPLKAATHRQLAIEPISGAINPPTYVDVNDYGEYVGVTTNPLTYTTCTFLAIPYGPVYLSELQDHPRAFDATIYGIAAPDVDYTHIQWGEPYTGPNTLDENGNYIGPFVYGSAVDETTQLPVDFRRSLDDSSIWWRDSNNGNIWRKVTANETPAVLNDWGEFAGRFNETLHEDFVYTWYSYDEGGSPTEVIYLDSWSSNGDGVFFFDGSYHLSVTGFNVFGISNDPQILIGSASPTHLWSDSVIAPLAKILPPSTPVTNAKICDGGLMILQSGNFVKILTPSDDADGDGMPDDWEMLYGFNPAVKDSNGDADNDGTNNLGEFLLRSNPNSAPDLTPEGITIDTRDGIDTDGDLIPNVWEYANGLDYLNFNDAALDFDRDGYTNLQEYRLSTDPRGAPVYRIRELGPFSDTSSVTISPGVLGHGVATSGGLSGNVVESLYFTAQPIGASGNRPAVWTQQRSDSQGSFAFYNQGATPTTTLVIQSPSGAALGKYGTSPTWFCYWASPNMAPVLLSGEEHDVRQLSNASFSPSGNYLVATRYQQSSNTYQLILWKMPAPQQAFQPIPLSAPPDATVSTSAKLQVNDAGFVTTTGKVGTENRGILWSPSINSSGNTVMAASVLSPLPGGNKSEVVGISNGSPNWVAGNSISGNISHAVVWPQGGNPIDLGTLGGTYSSVKLTSNTSRIAGVYELLVNGTLMSQAFIGRERLNTITNTKSWVIEAQGTPGGTITLNSLNDAGELTGTKMPYGAPSWISPSPTLWRHGREMSLHSSIPVASGYPLESIVSINSTGTLLARSIKSGAYVSLLLTPDMDTDGDGMPDTYENAYNFDPFVKQASSTDYDEDGLSDLEEFRNDTNPVKADTDSDGMKDGWEVSWGLLPLDSSDAQLDPDSDRVTNLRESVLGTNPTGTYRLEAQSFSGYLSSCANDGSVMLIQPGQVSYYNLLSLPDVNGIRHNASLIPSFYSTVSSPAYHTPAGDRVVRTLIHDPQNARGYGTQNGSYYLMPDSVGQPQNRITLTSIHGALMTSGILNTGSTLAPTTIVSSDGTRRLFNSSQGQLVLDESGTHISSLDPSIAWQWLNVNGAALAIRSCLIPATPEKAAHNASEILVSQGSSSRIIPLPGDWFPTTLNVAIQKLSDDNCALITRGVRNSYGVAINETYLLDLADGALTELKQPSVGNGYITALSSKNRRMLGDGNRMPFQITPDGSAIRLAALRIKSSPTAPLVQLSNYYPVISQAYHVTEDGRITLAVSQNLSIQPTQFIQLIPQNDDDNDGIPDDWELANSITDGAGDQDGDGLNDSDEFAHGSNPMDKDSDGDGMTDGAELAAGFDITNRDENYNGLTDGYEDLDNDRYLTREEVLCGTDARIEGSRPDGTLASMVSTNGTESPVLLARNFSFTLDHLRKASYHKPGEPEFDTGMITPVYPALTQTSGVPGNVEQAVQDNPKYYLEGFTDLQGSYDNDFKSYYNGVLNLEFHQDGSGNRLIHEVWSKGENGYISTIRESGTGSWHPLYGSETSELESYSLPNDWPAEYLWDYLFHFGDTLLEIRTKTEKNRFRNRTSSSDRSSPHGDELIIRDVYEDQGFSSEKLTLATEYPDSRLVADLFEELSNEDFVEPESSSYLGSYFTWNDDHSEVSSQDASYHLQAGIPAGSDILPNPRVLFEWKEVFESQEGGLTETKWIKEEGTLQPGGSYLTDERSLPHPDRPGTITPQVDDTGLVGPAILGAINPGESVFVDCQETVASGQTKALRTVQRGKAIRFQVGLSDQKLNPTLTATGSGKVTLWEQKKDGQWHSHSLPFKIPAEQSAGPSSHPGSYMLQGTTAGPVTLTIKVGSATRGSPLDLNVISTDLDIDADNSGEVNSSLEEEKAESDITRPGKVVAFQPGAPESGNGPPQSSDGLVELKLVTGNLQDGDEIYIRYSTNLMKIWKSPPNQIPTSDDFVDPDEIHTLSELGITAGTTKSLSIQATSSLVGQSAITVQVIRNEISVDDTVLVSFISIELDPSEEIIVPADVGEVPLSMAVHLPEPFSEAELKWTIEAGEGGLLEEETTTTSFGFASAKLKTSHQAGQTFRVKMTLTKLIEIKEDETETEHQLSDPVATATTGDIVVGPGAASEIVVDTGNLASLPADGRSEMTITADVTDEYGNPLALGSKVNWHLQGSGVIVQADEETRAGENGASIATAVLRAGSIPGLVQKLVIETDLTRKELLVPNTALNFSLAANTPVWTSLEGATSGTVTLTANVNAQDGTPILWQTTRGQVQASGVVMGGQAQATVLISGAETAYGIGVFTAAVGNSIAKASIPMQDSGTAAPQPPTVPGAGAAIQAISGLVATVIPSNGSFTAAEKAEMERGAMIALVQSNDTGFASGLLKLFPLEGGGGLQNQAAHANWRLRMAEFLDGQTAAIRQAAAEADKVHVTDAEGTQIATDMNNGQIQITNGNGLLLETDFGTEVMNAIRETGGETGWGAGLVKTLEYARSLNEMVTRSLPDFVAFIPSYSSSSMMPVCKNLVKKLGHSIFSNSHFQDAVEYFTPEGTTRLLKSLAQFTQTVQANQSVFAGLVFEDIGTNLLKPKLNEWAVADGGIETKMVAATVGYQYQGLLTFGTLAVTINEASNPHSAANLIKRMGGHLTGLAISASLGSQQAKDELWRMCPFASWYLLGSDVKAKWNGDDFFGSGQLAADLAIQAVGDLTIFIPVAKGVAAGVKFTNQVGRKLTQELAQVGPRSFARGVVQKAGASTQRFWAIIGGEVADATVTKQIHPLSCGPASGQMLLKNEGIDLFQSRLALLQGSVGTDASRLAKVMNEVQGTTRWSGRFASDGLPGNARKLFELFNKNGPFSAILFSRGMGVPHMVVVDGLEGVGKVLIRDPAGGVRYTMAWDEFTRVWTGGGIYKQ